MVNTIECESMDRQLDPYSDPNYINSLKGR